MVAIGTIKKAISGQLLFAPCLKDLEGQEKSGEKHFLKVTKNSV
jgi:hypothetical protein